MSDLSKRVTERPPEQKAIRAKCVHPSHIFVPYEKEEIEQSIPKRFEKLVKLYPQRLAIKTKRYELTYDALNRTANRVARAILAQRGEGEEPIALLFEHDAPLIAAILGVLKAGKIYVPLEPAHPRARMSYTLDDSQAALLVADDLNISLAKALAQDTRRLVNVDAIDSRLSDRNPDLVLSPDTLSFILYTSGSTGLPKGVFQNHRNILHRVMSYTNSLHICREDRLTLLHSCSFGASINNLFGALFNGAALFPFDVKTEGVTKLARWLVEEGITIYHSVPGVFQHAMEGSADTEKFPQLRVIHISGAPATRNDVEQYKKRFSSRCIFVHRMGTRETGTLLEYFIDKETPITGSGVPVGYAVEGSEVLLLDETGAEVGCNRVGEIAVKSRYLPLGYWRRDDLTRAAFAPDPKGSDARIYRTGDMGRMSPDGSLIHLGRKDFQAKIRGYRIEVGEIETALLELDGVKEAAVVAREDASGNKRLIAYIVPAGKNPLSINAIRGALADKLPDYMIPSVFVTQEALPLTPTGKVDRRALPVPAPIRPELDAPFVAPRTPIEETLAGIWAELLALDRVGIHDNFLDLGGNSLLAAQLISRVIKTFGVELSVQSLFKAPTVADMTAEITKNHMKQVGQEGLDRMLAEVERLSDNEVQRFISEERRHLIDRPK